MSLTKTWMLPTGMSLVVGALGCRERPERPMPELGREAVIAEIEKLGGGQNCVEYDEESPGRPIVGVNFEFSPLVTGDGLEILEGLNSLQRLNLNDTRQLTDAGLEHLEGLTSLQVLALANQQITDAGLEHLAGLTSLEWLHLNDTQVTDAGLEHLKGLTSLRDLHLYRTRVTDEGVRKLQQALPDCKIQH